MARHFCVEALRVFTPPIAMLRAVACTAVVASAAGTPRAAPGAEPMRRSCECTPRDAAWRGAASGRQGALGATGSLPGAPRCAQRVGRRRRLQGRRCSHSRGPPRASHGSGAGCRGLAPQRSWPFAGAPLRGEHKQQLLQEPYVRH